MALQHRAGRELERYDIVIVVIPPAFHDVLLEMQGNIDSFPSGHCERPVGVLANAQVKISDKKIEHRSITVTREEFELACSNVISSAGKVVDNAIREYDAVPAILS